MPGMVGPSDDERDLLLAYLAQQRNAIRLAAYGLTDEQARSSPSVSSLSVGGLIKHATDMERNWINIVQQRDHEADYEENFRLGPDETLADLFAASDAVAETTESVIRALSLDHPVPVPKGVPWFPDDVEAWSVRYVLLHVIEEIARHAGHADIVRESVDGATSFPLMAAAEGWPATPWMQPWQPPTG